MNKELQFRDFSTMTIHMQIPIQWKENFFKEKKNWEKSWEGQGKQSPLEKLRVWRIVVSSLVQSWLVLIGWAFVRQEGEVFLFHSAVSGGVWKLPIVASPPYFNWS